MEGVGGGTVGGRGAYCPGCHCWLTYTEAGTIVRHQLHDYFNAVPPAPRTKGEWEERREWSGCREWECQCHQSQAEAVEMLERALAMKDERT